MVQAIILILGGLTIFLLAQKNKFMRWGFVVGLISEPFWFYASIKSEQWGILILSIWYGFAYGLGVYNWWLKNGTEEKVQN